jgi:hypothetical protein
MRAAQAQGLGVGVMVGVGGGGMGSVNWPFIINIQSTAQLSA